MVFSKFKLQFYSEISLEQTTNFEEEVFFCGSVFLAHLIL